MSFTEWKKSLEVGGRVRVAYPEMNEEWTAAIRVVRGNAISLDVEDGSGRLFTFPRKSEITMDGPTLKAGMIEVTLLGAAR